MLGIQPLILQPAEIQLTAPFGAAGQDMLAGLSSKVPSQSLSRPLARRERGLGGSLDFGVGVQGRLWSNLTAGQERVQAMVADGPDFWIAGTDPSGGGMDSAWRVEKHRLSDGAAVPQLGNGAVIVSNPGSASDRVSAMAIDAARRILYVYGTESPGCPPRDLWRVEMRDADDGRLLDHLTLELTSQTDSADVLALGPNSL